MLISAVSICLMSFIGLETATLPSENVKNSRVTVPLATITGTLIAAVLYTLSYCVVGSAFSQEALGQTTKPMYEAARLFLGDFAGYALIICAGLGFFASINGVLFAQSYIIKYASEVKILPALFNKTSVAGFPIYAALLSTSVATVITVAIHNNHAVLPIMGGFTSCFVSLTYLWSVIAFRHLGGSIVLWTINFLTALCFLAGSLDTHIIPSAVLLYCASFFVYGMFVTNKKLKYL